MPGWSLHRPRPDDDELARQQQTWADLRAGRLPASARSRTDAAAADHVFTSDLSVGDFLAVRASGLVPVGQVFGTATFELSGSAQRLNTRYVIHPSGPYGVRPYRASAEPKLVRGWHEGANTARAHALTRLRAEVRAVTADGVLGVRIVRSTPGDGLYEFTVVGTAVRYADRRSAPETPFTTMLSALDVAQLVAAGWRPVNIVYEHQRYAGHAGFVSGGGRLNPLSYVNQELAPMAEVTTFAGVQTRQRMQAGFGPGESLLMTGYDVELDELECTAGQGQRDVTVDVQAVGSSIAPCVPAPPGRPAGRPAVVELR